MELYEIDGKILEKVGDYFLALRMKSEDTPVEDIYKTSIAILDKENKAYDAISKMILNYNADAAALRAEEIRLAERRRDIEKKSNELLNLLDAKFGKKTKFDVATLSYRRTESLEVSDASTTTGWLITNDHTDCVKYNDPEVKKTETKALLKSMKNEANDPDEVEIPGCRIVERNSYSLK